MLFLWNVFYSNHEDHSLKFQLAESLGVTYMECSPDDDVMTLAIIQRLTENVVKVGMRRTSFTIEIKPQTKQDNIKQFVCLCWTRDFDRDNTFTFWTLPFCLLQVYSLIDSRYEFKWIWLKHQ